MHFYHPEYNIDINTEDLNCRLILTEINKIYKKIPKTKCDKCPGKKKVESDCCKTFSPPMLFSEFINIVSDVSKNKNDAEIKELIVASIKTFLDISDVKECVLLEKNRCIVYEQRPFSCRMFGLYSSEEWSDRLKKISEHKKCKIEELPFYKQCKGISKTGKTKKISRLHSDILFRDLHDLDVKIFPDDKIGKKFVFQSKTYMPFYVHFLLINLGPQMLENLAIIREDLEKTVEKVKHKEIDKKSLDKKIEQVSDFIKTFEENFLRKNRQ